MTCHYSDSAFDDGEPCAIFTEKDVKTRKEHKCVECCRVIPPGERCKSSSSLFEGKWDRAYRCLECVFVVEYVETKIKACIPWGMLKDAANDWDIDISQFPHLNDATRSWGDRG